MHEKYFRINTHFHFFLESCVKIHWENAVYIIALGRKLEEKYIGYFKI
jgi:hypothetical protein